jgi:hypothetical protein
MEEADRILLAASAAVNARRISASTNRAPPEGGRSEKISFPQSPLFSTESLSEDRGQMMSDGREGTTRRTIGSPLE